MLICLCENHNINILLIQHFPTYLRMGSKVFFCKLYWFVATFYCFKRHYFTIFPTFYYPILHIDNVASALHS